MIFIFKKRFIKFKCVFLLSSFFWTAPVFCYADSSVEQLIQDRLSEDKKTLNLSGANIGTRGAKILRIIH